MSAFEGPEYGLGDFVLMNNINIDEFMKNLKLRFEKHKIYTFIGKKESITRVEKLGFQSLLKI